MPTPEQIQRARVSAIAAGLRSRDGQRHPILEGLLRGICADLEPVAMRISPEEGAALCYVLQLLIQALTSKHPEGQTSAGLAVALAAFSLGHDYAVAWGSLVEADYSRFQSGPYRL